MSRRLELIQEELDKARTKKEKLELQIQELERKYRETENTEIHDIVRAANLTPEQLLKLLTRMEKELPQGEIPGEIFGKNEEEKNPPEETETALKMEEDPGNG